jgi:hypothetical protein
LCLGAATISRAAFAEWFRFLAQPPLDSKSAIADLIAKVSSYPEWEEMLLSPYHAAWASRVLEDRLPVDLHKDSGGAGLSAKSAPAARTAQTANALDAPFPGGEADLLSAWKESRASAERIRKGAKALRDRFCARLTGFGQSVAGLPKDMRAALDALDKPLPWTAKAEAELELELYLNRMTGKAGAAAAAVEAKAKAKADPVDQQREVKRIQDLSGRFKKL